jgi:hypothetical protein
LYYQVRGIQPNFLRFKDLYLPPGTLYEEYLKYPDLTKGFNISIIRVSKDGLREEIEHWQEMIQSHNDTSLYYSGLFVNKYHETIYIWKYGALGLSPRTVEILWWSPKSTLPWS